MDWKDTIMTGEEITRAAFKAREQQRIERYEKRIKELQETCSQWQRLAAEMRQQGREEVWREVIEWIKLARGE